MLRTVHRRQVYRKRTGAISSRSTGDRPSHPRARHLIGGTFDPPRLPAVARDASRLRSLRSPPAVRRNRLEPPVIQAERSGSANGPAVRTFGESGAEPAKSRYAPDEYG